MSARKGRIPPDECSSTEFMKCIWMISGNIAYKLCDRGYDCERCPLDGALHQHKAKTISRPMGKVPLHEVEGTSSRAESSLEGSLLGSVEGFRLDLGIFYHRNHYWARVESSGKMRIGLDDFGQKLLGRVYSVKLPKCSTKTGVDDPSLRLAYQSGEVSLFVPFPGVVEQVNDRLEQHPSLVNQDPYGLGWLMVIQPKSLEEDLKPLYYGDQAKAWLPEEISGLKQMVSQLMEASRPQVGVTLQNGGMEIEDLARIMSPAQHRRIIGAFLGVPSPG